MQSLENREFFRRGARDHGVLLVHGLGGGPHEVQRLAESLHTRAGLSVRGMRLPGHGTGGWRMPASQWQQWSAALTQAHVELCGHYPRVDLIGFSTGATLVLREASLTPVRGRVVLLAPFVRLYRPTGLPWQLEAVVRRLAALSEVPRRRPPLRDPQVRAEVARCAGYRTFNLHAVRSALTLIDETMPRVGDVLAPTLIIQGWRDRVVDATAAFELQAALADARLLSVDSDHLLTLDVAADQVATETAKFLIGGSVVAGSPGATRRG